MIYCSETTFDCRRGKAKEANLFLKMDDVIVSDLKKIYPLCKDCYEKYYKLYGDVSVLHPTLVSKEQYLMQEALE